MAKSSSSSHIEGGDFNFLVLKKKNMLFGPFQLYQLSVSVKYRTGRVTPE